MTLMNACELSSSSHSMGQVLVSSTRITRLTIVGCHACTAVLDELTRRNYLVSS